MSKIDIETYFKERFEPKYEFFEFQARRHRRYYLRIRMAEIVFAALIPLKVAFIPHETILFKVLVGGFAVLVTILSGMLLLNRYQEKWITFRATADALQREKYLFLTRRGEYHHRNAEGIFVEQVEAILNNEEKQWQGLVLSEGGLAAHQESD